VCEDGVEDVKWSNFNQSIFASAHSDGKLNLYQYVNTDGTLGLDNSALLSLGKRTKAKFTHLISIKKMSICCYLEEQMEIPIFGMFGT
jgi:hypothetical protein